MVILCFQEKENSQLTKQNNSKNNDKNNDKNHDKKNDNKSNENMEAYVQQSRKIYSPCSACMYINTFSGDNE